MSSNAPRAGLVGRTVAVCAVLACLIAAPHATAASPAPPHTTVLVDVQRTGYSIAGMVVHVEGATRFKHGIALFPGSPGILRLREEGGRVRNDMNGNFLIRSRTEWLDDETLVVAVDAPSDQWASFPQALRESPRYGEDVHALLSEIGRRYAVGEWTFVGTSEGTVSAFHAARMNPALARRVILTASLFSPNKNGRGLVGADFGQLRSSLLWVHHVDDPCRVTAYASARAYAQRTGAPLVSVRGGGPGSGAECQARTPHGFINMEAPTVKAMQDWVKTGKAPAEVGP